MQTQSLEQIRAIVAQLKSLGDQSVDLDLWQELYQFLPADQQARISEAFANELSNLQAV
jgi:hypothetical protein